VIQVRGLPAGRSPAANIGRHLPFSSMRTRRWVRDPRRGMPGRLRWHAMAWSVRWRRRARSASGCLPRRRSSSAVNLLAGRAGVLAEMAVGVQGFVTGEVCALTLALVAKANFGRPGSATLRPDAHTHCKGEQLAEASHRFHFMQLLMDVPFTRCPCLTPRGRPWRSRSWGLPIVCRRRRGRRRRLACWRC
jgi:hypothetical protein